MKFFSQCLRSVAVLAVALSMVAANCSASLNESGFDSYTPGELLGQSGWQPQGHNANGQYANLPDRVAVRAANDRGNVLVWLAGYPAVQQTRLMKSFTPAQADKVSIRFDAMPGAATVTGRFIFDAVNGTDSLSLRFVQGTLRVATSANPTYVNTGLTFQANAWNSIELQCDLAAHKVTVVLDGQKSAPIDLPAGLNRFQRVILFGGGIDFETQMDNLVIEPVDSFAAVALHVVTGGVAAADIVIPDAPTQVVQYAAQELQAHIKEATGVELAILTESTPRDPDAKAAIYLGPTLAANAAGLNLAALQPNAYRTLAIDNDLYLAGNDGVGNPLASDATPMGTLFAVYRWLDKQMGVRWLWPGQNGKVVPHVTDVVVYETDTTELPWSMHSRIRNWAWVNEIPVADKEAYLAEVNVWFLRQLMARVDDLDYGHAYGDYWTRFGATNPEFFAMREDGVRAPLDTRTHLVQMCVSSPGLHQQIITDWLSKRTARRPWVNGVENDRRTIDPFCTCAACLAWDSVSSTGPSNNYSEDAPGVPGESTSSPEQPAKSVSDRYARFWLSLQDAASAHVSNPKVIGYAYTDYAEAPAEVQLNENIIVGVVPRYRYPAPEATREAFHTTWAGWDNVGATPYLRPNYFLYGYAMPYIFAREFGEDFKFSQAHGMKGTDFDSLTGMWGVQGPNLYMLGRLHARPDLEVEEVLDEYYAGFGPASAQVRDYFDYWADVTTQFGPDFEPVNGGGWNFVGKAGDLVYTPAVMAAGRDLLDLAIVAAANDPAAAEKVRYLNVWLEHAELCMNTLRAYRALLAGPPSPALGQNMAQARAALDQFRIDHKDDLVAANMGLTRRIENWSGWRTLP